MAREYLRRKHRRDKRQRARDRRGRIITTQTAKLAEVIAPLRPDLAALGDPVFPPLPTDPADRFAAAMGQVALSNSRKAQQCAERS